MNGRLSWGVILIAAGILFLLDSAGVLNIGEFISLFWPLLLVLWGAWVLWGRTRAKQETVVVSGPLADIGIGRRVEEFSTDRVSSANVLGDVRSRIVSASFAGGTLSSVMGDVEADLTGAVLAPGEQLLKLDTVMGDVEILLPPNTAFSVTGDAVMGKVVAGTESRKGFFPSLEYATPGYKDAARRIRIDASTVMGEVSVRQKAG